jgi:PilZ domain
LRYSVGCDSFTAIRQVVTAMTTPPVRVERRVGQRFPYLLPLSIRQAVMSIEGVGFTQDLSSRGVFFFTDAPLAVGAEIELTLRMPSEITLGESMPVRCRGRILRIGRPAASSSQEGTRTGAQTKIGVAVRLEGYEYLSEAASSSPDYARISGLHQPREDDLPLTQFARSVLG